MEGNKVRFDSIDEYIATFPEEITKDATTDKNSNSMIQL